jgi:hypothetical protein
MVGSSRIRIRWFFVARIVPPQCRRRMVTPAPPQVDVVGRQLIDIADPRTERELHTAPRHDAVRSSATAAGVPPAFEDDVRFALTPGSMPLGLDRALDHHVVGTAASNRAEHLR